MEKELAHDDPKFLPTQYGLTEQQLNQLAVDYDPKLIPEATEVGDEGYQQVHTKVMAIIKVRTNIDKVRKGLKEDSLKWGRKVDGEAKRLTKIVEDLEAPWKKVKLDLEEAERKAAEEAMAAEQKRMDEIEGRIAGIRNLAEGLIGADAEAIQKRIDELLTLSVTEELFGDYVEAAKLTGDITLKSLRSALEERTAFEANRKHLEKEQAEMKLQQDALAAEKKELEEEKAAMKASEDAAKAAEEKEAQRKQDVKDAAQRSADAGEATRKDKAKMKARLPQDQEAREYAKRLTDVAFSKPDLDDEELFALVEAATAAVVAAVKIIEDNTQEAADDVDSD